LRRWFLTYTVPSRQPGLAPSGSAGASRPCQGCSRPHPRLRVRAASCFKRPATTGRRQQPPTAARSPAPRGALGQVFAQLRLQGGLEHVAGQLVQQAVRPDQVRAVGFAWASSCSASCCGSTSSAMGCSVSVMIDPSRQGTAPRVDQDQNHRYSDTPLLDIRPPPGPGRGAVSRQSSRDKQRKRSLLGSTVRREGRAISGFIVDLRIIRGDRRTRSFRGSSSSRSIVRRASWRIGSAAHVSAGGRVAVATAVRRSTDCSESDVVSTTSARECVSMGELMVGLGGRQ
jgi:hypothetical protein